MLDDAITAFFSLPIMVEELDIDHMGHVNNSIYLRWIEKAVHSHWEALATCAEFDAYRWVAVRHEIDYRSPALRGDMVSIDTRIVRVRRARAWYETKVRRGAIILAEALSCWVCVDPANGAPTVIPPEMTARFLPTG